MSNRFRNRLEHIRSTSTNKDLPLTNAPQATEVEIFDSNLPEGNSNLKKHLERIRTRNQKITHNKTLSADELQIAKSMLNINKTSGWQRLNTFCEVYTTHVPLPHEFSSHLSSSWPSLIPQTGSLFENEQSVSCTSLLFFDLETTGLSGGAGTIAFLSAFGSFSFDKESQSMLLSIRQYLLLDYQGERDYLDAIQKELSNTQTYLVSYNGRTFDEQVIRTRFLLNGLKFPDHVYHFDLLYPARILWKRYLDNCSQKTLETAILGKDRGYDLGGEFAPCAWFEYLRTGNKAKLLEIVEHNRKDIEGLAEIFFVINAILEDPHGTPWIYDKTRLGIRLTQKTKKLSLLKESADNNAEAMLAYGSECLKQGQIPEGIAVLTKLAHKSDAPSLLRCDALRKLAIHAEWDKKNYQEALLYTHQALQLTYVTEQIKLEFEKRKARLREKIVKYM